MKLLQIKAAYNEKSAYGKQIIKGYCYMAECVRLFHTISFKVHFLVYL